MMGPEPWPLKFCQPLQLKKTADEVALEQIGGDILVPFFNEGQEIVKDVSFPVRLNGEIQYEYTDYDQF